VIGRGKLLREGSRDDLAQISSQFVHVRTPLRNEFIELSQRQGWEIREEGETFVVDNVASSQVGAATFEAHIPLFELSPHGASLEDLFMQLTADSVEYVGKRRGIRGVKKS
jgi:ABC-2 type transport system ATP-binding protein